MPTPIKRLLIANRGEIAVRIARTARETSIHCAGLYAEDDANASWLGHLDEVRPLKGHGPAAWLDAATLVSVAQTMECDALHPGYGFLAEHPALAEACDNAGIRFIGPCADTLAILGDKLKARAHALALGIPVPQGTHEPTTLAIAHEWLQRLPRNGSLMLKAVAGGGGRGMRRVSSATELEACWHACTAEALAAFGNGDLYVEQCIDHARHVEIQIAGDGTGAVVALGDRDCSLQRRHQKLIEFAPAPALPDELRARMVKAAVYLGESLTYRSLGTIEFLVDVAAGEFFFMEANPRIQVEHTITEAITGLDLVDLQLRLAQGVGLGDLDLTRPPRPRGCAVQLRINCETVGDDGRILPAGGSLTRYMPPTGTGLRIDDGVQAGEQISPLYDSLAAKLIVHADDFPRLLARARRAATEFIVEGVPSSLPLIRTVFTHPAIVDYDITTRFLEESVLPSFKPATPRSVATTDQLVSPVPGMVAALQIAEGDAFSAGDVLAVVTSMKMEFPLRAPGSGQLRRWAVQAGGIVSADALLAELDINDNGDTAAQETPCADPDHVRPELAESLERHALTLDERRPAAVARRARTGQRTARANVEDLLDPGSFIEYGALTLAGQRARLSLGERLAQSPADGLIAGMGSVNAAHVSSDNARCMVLAYDYTVFAGTQGLMNHKKIDRLLHVAGQWRVPVVLFAEGGGGRPGDTDFTGVSALDSPTFKDLATLSALVPLVAIVSGRCFAGNAALAGCCDVIIATRNATLGMAGPAMIEGGGLGRFSPEEVGPVSVQGPNGVIDIIVEDEAEAVAIARRYLGYFQGVMGDGSHADQRILRHLIPENRKHIYEIRSIIDTLFDSGSFLELRRGFASGMVTGLARLQGRPVGVIANDCRHLGGAIDAAGGDKGARFLQLCDAHDLPVISLCDTPGFMVGPNAEREGTVRHVSRLFVTAASIDVPLFTVVLRKGYGLGAQAMAGGSFHASVFTVAWPTGEFGAMGFEGAVRLGYAKELAAIDNPEKREKFFRRLVRRAYQHGKAINVATALELDDVIDPADTRRWLLQGLASVPRPQARTGKKRPCIDTW